MAQATKAAKPNVAARFGRYVGDVRAEMRRVVWPSPQEVWRSSIIVLVTLVFFIALTLLVDNAATFVISQLNRLGG